MAILFGSGGRAGKRAAAETRYNELKGQGVTYKAYKDGTYDLMNADGTIRRDEDQGIKTDSGLWNMGQKDRYMNKQLGRMFASDASLAAENKVAAENKLAADTKAANDAKIARDAKTTSDVRTARDTEFDTRQSAYKPRKTLLDRNKNDTSTTTTRNSTFRDVVKSGLNKGTDAVATTGATGTGTDTSGQKLEDVYQSKYVDLQGADKDLYRGSANNMGLFARGSSNSMLDNFLNITPFGGINSAWGMTKNARVHGMENIPQYIKDQGKEAQWRDMLMEGADKKIDKMKDLGGGDAQGYFITPEQKAYRAYQASELRNKIPFSQYYADIFPQDSEKMMKAFKSDSFNRQRGRGNYNPKFDQYYSNTEAKKCGGKIHRKAKLTPKKK